MNNSRTAKLAGVHANTGAVGEYDKQKQRLKADCPLHVKKLNYNYPERTDGSKHARELRERTNHISDKERAELFERAMQRIYGSRVKAPVGPGH